MSDCRLDVALVALDERIADLVHGRAHVGHPALEFGQRVADFAVVDLDGDHGLCFRRHLRALCGEHPQAAQDRPMSRRAWALLFPAQFSAALPLRYSMAVSPGLSLGGNTVTPVHHRLGLNSNIDSPAIGGQTTVFQR